MIKNMKMCHETKESLLSAAAKIIISDIRSMNASKSHYPSVSDTE